MKKVYTKPAMQVVLMKQQTRLLSGSYASVSGAKSSGLGQDEELNYVGQGDYEAR